MNTRNLPFRLSSIALAAGLITSAIAIPAQAAGSAGGGGKVSMNDIHFIGGSDRNWFNPANWSSGRLPGVNDRVLLDGSDYVVIDPTQRGGSYRVSFGDLVVSSVATLEVLNGAIVESRDRTQADGGRIIFRSSGDIGRTLIAGVSSDPTPPNGEQECYVDANGVKVCAVPGEGGTGGGGVFLNPNPKSTSIIVLKSSATVDYGFGGTRAASITQDAAGGVQMNAGVGHYSTVTTDTAVLDGDLKVSLYYGFEPRPGDRFQIMTVNGTRTGQFLGLPEGGYVGCTDSNVGLRLSYVGGDGNDLVITAEQTDPGVCLLLPAVQKVRSAANERSKAKLPSPTTPISGPKPPRK